MKRIRRALLATAVIGGLFAVGASPAGAAVTNGGFEVPDITPAAFQITTPTGWALTPSVPGGNVVILKSPTFTVTEGTQALDLSGLSPNPPAAPTAGGVQQILPGVLALRPGTLTYDWTSKCAGSNVRVFVNGLLVDSATNAAATYPSYSTRVVNLVPNSATSTLRIDTTTTGPTLASNQICGTIIDNVTFTQAATVTPTASAASQCSGATGHRVQFRKVNFGIISGALADDAYLRNATDAAVLRQATDNGVAAINYSDGGFTLPLQATIGGTIRDVGEPPLTGVSGPTPFVPGGTFAESDPNTVMRSSGYISVPTAGTWNFTVTADDWWRLLIGQPALLVGANEGGPATADTSQTLPVTFSAPGCYHYEFQHANGPGSSAIALSATGPGQATPTAVGLGLLPVFQGTDSPLTCQIIAVRPGPSFIGPNDSMSLSVSDLDGVGGVYNIQATNATVQSFQGTWGTTGPFEVRATKMTQGAPAAFSFTISDWNGNTKTCT